MNGRENHRAAALIEPLTRREREILDLLAQGFSAPEIAQKLILARSSVKWYIQQLYGKLGVNSKRQAINRALALQLLSPRPLWSEPVAERAASAPRLNHNLPRPNTRFFGDERAIVSLQERLVEYRLITLTGPGGVGKTRLALQLAEAVLSAYPEGVWFVELAALSDPTLVPQQATTVLGLPDEPGRPFLESLLYRLRDRRLLLILDNCEHVLEAAAQLAQSLLQACPRLQLLATSRELLGVGGEAVFEVPSLSFPDPHKPPAVESFYDYAAVRLFVDRARLVLPGYTLSPRNAAAIALICQRLDGIPLALELAAARVKALTEDQLASRLHDTLRLLTGGSRTTVPRQRTLRAALDWSHNLLSPAQRELLRRLSVFCGGWSLDAAEAIGRSSEPTAPLVLDLLTDLVSKSLVTVDRQAGREVRYRFLETVRQYAYEKLVAAGDEARVKSLHLDYLLKLATAAQVGLRGPDQLTWLECFQVEHDNFRAALEWALQDLDGLAASLCLGAALADFWGIQGYYREGRRWLERILAAEAQAGAVVRASPATITARARVLAAAGQLALYQADFTAARSCFETTLALCQPLADELGLAQAFTGLGDIHVASDNFAAARACYLESHALRQRLGLAWAVAESTRDLGELAYSEGQLEASLAFAEENLTLYRRLQDRRGLGLALLLRGWLAVAFGDLERAKASFVQALVQHAELGFKRRMARSLGELANLAVASESWERAASFYVLTEALINETGSGFPANFQDQLTRGWAATRAHLAPELYARLADQARALSELEIVPFAMDDYR
jgi:non-specific serine/threonine protein kinase